MRSGSTRANRSGKSRAPGVIFGDRFPRFAQALAFRAIDKRARIGKRRENFLLRIGKPARRGIRRGQIEEFLAASPVLFESPRQAVRFQPPIRARCKHGCEK